MKTIERVKLIKKQSRDSSITPPRPKVKESLKVYNRKKNNRIIILKGD